MYVHSTNLLGKTQTKDRVFKEKQLLLNDKPSLSPQWKYILARIHSFHYMLPIHKLIEYYHQFFNWVKSELRTANGIMKHNF